MSFYRNIEITVILISLSVWEWYILGVRQSLTRNKEKLVHLIQIFKSNLLTMNKLVLSIFHFII